MSKQACFSRCARYYPKFPQQAVGHPSYPTGGKPDWVARTFVRQVASQIGWPGRSSNRWQARLGGPDICPGFKTTSSWKLINRPRDIVLPNSRPRARPHPSIWIAHQSTTNRIPLNVVDGPAYRVPIVQIPVVAATFLPEPVYNTFATLGTYPVERLWRLISPISNCSSCETFFQHSKNMRHIIRIVLGVDQQMNVFGHDDIRPDGEIAGATRLVPCLDELQAQIIACQELLAALA